MGSFSISTKRCFVCRTYNFIREYEGPLDATLLLNCLLGLLVTPFEKYKREVRAYQGDAIFDFFTSLDDRYDDFGNGYDTYRIIRCMRNSIAHFNIQSYSDNDIICGFVFSNPLNNGMCPIYNCDCPEIEDNGGFNVRLSLNEIKKLIEILYNEVFIFEDNAVCETCQYKNTACSR